MLSLLSVGTESKLPLNVRFYAIVKMLFIIFLISLPLGLLMKSLLGFFLLFLFLFGIPSLIYNFLWLNSFSFIIDNEQISITSGIFIKKTSIIPYNKIQNINVVKTPFLNLFNLSGLKIWTGSLGQVEVSKKRTSIKPDAQLILTSEDVEWLQDFVIDKNNLI